MIALLLNHLWQSTLFALAAALFTLALRHDAARVRYWLWQVASIKFLIPFSILMTVGRYFGGHAAPALPPQPVAVAMAFVAQPFPVAAPIGFGPVPSAAGLTPIPILCAVWVCGFAAILLLWLRRWLQIAAALRRATALSLDAPIPVKSSISQLEPGLVGIFRPVLLLPEGIAGRLTAKELQTIVRHELFHLQRRDNLTAAIHMLVQALFWFHPLVWWLGARLVEERERACDEAVVNSGSDPETYAEAILKVCKFYIQSPLACTAGVSGADLKKRIEIIMTNRNAPTLSLEKQILLSFGVAATIAGPMMAGWATAPQTHVRPELPDPLARVQTASTQNQSVELFARQRAEQAMMRRDVFVDPKLLDAYVGSYQIGPEVVLTISAANGHLLMLPTGQVPIDMYPESDLKFFSKLAPMQISFTEDFKGAATGLVLHQGGDELPAPRISEAAAIGIEAKLSQRIKDNLPSPGTEAALRHQIDGLMSGHPDYAAMGDGLAASTREQLPMLKRNFDKWGSLQSVSFKGVGHGSADVYDVMFEHGLTEWRISPLAPDGKVIDLSGRNLP